MTTLKLMVESIDFDSYDKEIKIDDSGKRLVKIKGPYAMSNKKNANGRIYPGHILNEQMHSYIKEKIKTNCSGGELEHPERVFVASDRICHKVKSLKQDASDENIWLGESVITTGTPCGDIAASLIDWDIRLGISTRGVGKLDESGYGNEVNSYRLIAFDLVTDPSTGQFVDGILESKDFMVTEHGLIVEMSYANLEKKLSTLPTNVDERREAINSAAKEFLLSLRK
jgi:hypothetical protein